MARRFRRQRRKSSKKSPPGSVDGSDWREMSERTGISSPENLAAASHDGMGSAAGPGPDKRAAAAVPFPSLGLEGGFDSEKIHEPDPAEFDPSQKEMNVSASGIDDDRVSIGLVHPAFDHDIMEPKAALMLTVSPIPASKENHLNEHTNHATISGDGTACKPLHTLDSWNLEAHNNMDAGKRDNLPETAQSTVESDANTAVYDSHSGSGNSLNDKGNNEQIEEQQRLSGPFLSPIMEASFDKGDHSMQQSSRDQVLHIEEDECMNEMNESAMSASFSREDQIARTQEELGATSLAFLHRLRGAAFRRKKALVHSRDDMVAKERSHREDIEAARFFRRQSAPEPSLLTVSPKMDQKKQVNSEHTFKARPAPNAMFAGSTGVPKVEKRPVTVPQSPQLGLRRLNKPFDRSLLSNEDNGRKGSFAALPLPKSIGEAGSGGQSGVPKVSKRPVTEAVSPLLGLRRGKTTVMEPASIVSSKPATKPTGFKALPVPKSLKANGVSGVPRVASRPTTVPWSPLLGFRRKIPHRTEESKVNGRGSSLAGNAALSPMGVGLVSSPIADENAPPEAFTISRPDHESVSDPGYEPHSTARANRRAEYDAYLAARQRDRLEEERRRRCERAKELKRELGELRKEL